MDVVTHTQQSSAFVPNPTVGNSCWIPAGITPDFSPEAITIATTKVRETAYVIQCPRTHAIGVVAGTPVHLQQPAVQSTQWNSLGVLPPIYPEWLGDRSFNEKHGTRFPYVSGAMANGIATTDIVIAMSQAGFLGFFGAAGLSPQRVHAAIAELNQTLGDRTPWGANLIHSPAEPDLEEEIAEFYINNGVKRVSAAAYMGLTTAIVRYALSGLKQNADGSISRERYVFAKISRPETASHFLKPAPQNILDKLLERGHITAEEARLAQYVPVAEDIIVESDSGGHTDNRALGVLFPLIRELADKLSAEHGYTRPIRVGAAGGIGRPEAVASAFALGAAFVLTGTVNQACVESGLDVSGKQMLAQADMADVIMAPAADMFEMGVEVQVLKRGTMFANRAKKLYELYRAYPSLESIPAEERARVEKQSLQATFEEAWANTRDYWQSRDPREVERANNDPKHKMALVFRAYLGQSSRWAIAGDANRRTDFQIWCGPAMGAFNQWTKGSFLEAPENRTVVQVARNFMEGAAVITRAQQLRTFGAPVPSQAFEFKPRQLA